MAYDVSSMFQVEMEKQFSTPVRRFFLGSSDYTSRVTHWPKFKRKAQEFDISNLTITLVNDDGGMNTFYEENYKMAIDAYIKIGWEVTSTWEVASGTGGADISLIDEDIEFIDSDIVWSGTGSGDTGTSSHTEEELITVFTGQFNRIKYEDERTTIYLKDKLYDMTQYKIGDTTSPVDISSMLVSDFYWTIVTCYGHLSNVESNSNPDIDWDSFQDYAAVWSDADVGIGGYFTGEKVSEALSNLAKYTDSIFYTEGDGKVYQQRFSNVNTLATVVTEEHTVKLFMDVLARDLINKQFVGFDYDVDSETWQTLYDEDAISQNSFGVHEDFLKFDNVWFINSASAINMAQRRVARYKEPPRVWRPKVPLVGLIRQMGETIKFVNSFFNQTSASGVRIVENIFDMENGLIEFALDTSVQFNPFTLDVDSLDHPDRYLI